jgi:co-chaperonin GroES (HSP10)
MQTIARPHPHPAPDEGEQKAGGIILDSAKEKPQQGKVTLQAMASPRTMASALPEVKAGTRFCSAKY